MSAQPMDRRGLVACLGALSAVGAAAAVGSAAAAEVNSTLAAVCAEVRAAHAAMEASDFDDSMGDDEVDAVCGRWQAAFLALADAPAATMAEWRAKAAAALIVMQREVRVNLDATVEEQATRAEWIGLCLARGLAGDSGAAA